MSQNVILTYIKVEEITDRPSELMFAVSTHTSTVRNVSKQLFLCLEDNFAVCTVFAVFLLYSVSQPSLSHYFPPFTETL